MFGAFVSHLDVLSQSDHGRHTCHMGWWSSAWYPWYPLMIKCGDLFFVENKQIWFWMFVVPSTQWFKFVLLVYCNTSCHLCFGKISLTVQIFFTYDICTESVILNLVSCKWKVWYLVKMQNYMFANFQRGKLNLQYNKTACIREVFELSHRSSFCGSWVCLLV